jgi:hypothetical protein
VFVHGFTDTGKEAWDKFPNLLYKDEELSPLDVCIWIYPSYGGLHDEVHLNVSESLMRYILSFFIVGVLLCAQPAWSDVSYDTASSSTGVSCTSHSHTFASHANLAIIIASLRDGGGPPSSVSSITVAENNATLIAGCAGSSGNARIEMWYHLKHPRGAQTVVVTVGGTIDQMVTGVIFLIGAATSSTFGTCVTSLSSGTNVDVYSISSALGELGVMGLATNAAPTCAPDATAVVSDERYDTANGANIKGCGYTEPGAAGTINIRADLGASNSFAAAGVSVRALRRASGGVILFQ